MAQDLRGTRQVARPSRPGFFLRASRSPPHLRGKLSAAAKASPLFAPDQEPPAFRRAPPNIATPPRSAPPPARTFQSIVRGRHRADKLLRPIEVLQQRASPSPAVSVIPLAKSAPSIILHDRRHQPRGKVLRHAAQRGVLLFKEVLNAVRILLVGRNLILVAEDKIVRVVEHLPRLALFERD